MPLGLDLLRVAVIAKRAQALQSLMLLRLIMLSLTLLGLGLWHFFKAPLALGFEISIVLVFAFFWSLLVVNSKRLQELAWSNVRELLIDYAWVFIVVFLGGRSANPFIYYYIVLAALAAVMLPNLSAWFFCLLGVIIYSALMLLDSGAHFAHFSNDFQLHLLGMWINFVASSVVICFFVTNLISRLRIQHQRLSSVRETQLKNEQLVALATVSASTVHNLATPLSTLGVLVDDIASHSGLDQNLSSDVELMRKQIARCRATMNELSDLADNSDTLIPIKAQQLADLLREHYSLHFPQLHLAIELNCSEELQFSCSPLLEYALINLINNALESSPEHTRIVFKQESSSLVIVITNESEQKAEEIIERWGRLSSSEKQSGLGIGSLLANSTIERQGGRVKFDIEPLADSRTGAKVNVSVVMPI